MIEATKFLSKIRPIHLLSTHRHSIHWIGPIGWSPLRFQGTSSNQPAIFGRFWTSGLVHWILQCQSNSCSYTICARSTFTLATRGTSWSRRHSFARTAWRVAFESLRPRNFYCCKLVVSWRSTTKRRIQLRLIKVQGAWGPILNIYWDFWRWCDDWQYDNTLPRFWGNHRRCKEEEGDEACKKLLTGKRVKKEPDGMSDFSRGLRQKYDDGMKPYLPDAVNSKILFCRETGKRRTTSFCKPPNLERQCNLDK